MDRVLFCGEIAFVEQTYVLTTSATFTVAIGKTADATDMTVGRKMVVPTKTRENK